MEPITTTIMTKGLVAYLAKKVSEDKAITGFFSDLSEAAVNWIKPIFLEEDGTETKAIQNLRKNPTSKARQTVIAADIEIAIEDDPKREKHLKEIFEKMQKTEEGGKIVQTIINSNQTITGNVGGDVNQTYNER